MTIPHRITSRAITWSCALLLLCGCLDFLCAQSKSRSQTDTWSKAIEEPKAKTNSTQRQPRPVIKQQHPGARFTIARDKRFQDALERGDAAYEAKQYDQAEAQYIRARNLFPANPYPYIGLGSVSYMTQRYAAAAKAYEKALANEVKANNKNLTYEIDYSLWYEVAFYLGNAHFNLKNYDDAAKLYQALTKYRADDYALFYNLGRSYFHLGRYVQAAEPFRRLVQLLPEDPVAYYWLGGTYYLQGDYSGAIKQCRKAVDIDAGFASGYYGLGLVYVATKRKKEAMEQYRALVDLNSELADKLLGHISVRFGSNKPPPPPENKRGETSQPSRHKVVPPSLVYRTYTGGNLFGSVSVPDNWRQYKSSSSLGFAPEGAYTKFQGRDDFTHGIILVSVNATTDTLRRAAEQNVDAVLQANPHLRIRGGNFENGNIGNHHALIRTLSGTSNVTGRTETVTVYTTLLRNGKMFYLFTTAPHDEYDNYRRVFQRIINSIRFAD